MGGRMVPALTDTDVSEADPLLESCSQIANEIGRTTAKQQGLT